ncbi:caspase-3-like [Haliotis cracherodii]|uniref:caspase-3-like n=1 Tax=Haliotis cracherodii TaxID=6455 RepID=UPI0039E816F5
MAEGRRVVSLHVLGSKGSGKSLFIRQLANTRHCKKLKLGKRCYVVELDLETLIGVPVLVNITEYRGVKSNGALAFAYHKADACLLFYDREEAASFDRAQMGYIWCHYFMIGNPNTFVVGNKCDRLDRNDVRLEAVDAFINKFGPVKGHFSVSAETGCNIKPMLVDVLQQVLEERFVINSSPAQLEVALRNSDPHSGVQIYAVEETAGLCVIVNNDTFENLPYRDGAVKDVENIESTFGPLGFDMRYIENKDVSSLIRRMHDISKMDHTMNSMFVCFIMSHGSRNSILGVDGLTIDLDRLTSLFSAQQCPSLAGKPKLFIIQACQGSMVQSPANAHSDSAAIPEVTRERPTVPEFGDLLIAHSTITGFVAYRYPDRGSPFISTLCNKIQNFPENHMVDILTMVNGEVAAMNFGGSFKQMPMFQSRLRKRLYLKRLS